MMPSFNCHHFTKQNVLSLDDEPLAMCCEEDMLFVATQPSQIHVFDLKADPPKLVAHFPTMGHVTRIVFSKTGNFVATVERIEGNSIASVQAYFGWEKAKFSQAVSVRIAGYMTSQRCEGNCVCVSDESSQIQVIEIPLKGEAAAFSVNGDTGGIVIAVGKHLLVYGLSCKVAASTGKVYKELKCLLDLQFTFVIQYIDHHGDFFLCASRSECQLVQLNVEKKCNESFEELQTVTKEMTCCSIKQDNHNPDTKSNTLDAFINWFECPDLNPNPKNYIVNDTNFIQWDFLEDAAGSCSLVQDSHVRYAAKNISVPSIHGKDNKQKVTHSKQIVILGPDPQNKMPEVIVEYEDTCCLKGTLQDLVQRGTTSHLYCYLPPSSTQKFIHPLLVPVSLPKDNDSTQTEDEQTNMYCVISTTHMSYVYRLFGDEASQLMAVYSYTTNIKQVCVSDCVLYALSSTCLDIYCCHVIADSIQCRQCSHTNHKLPPNYHQEPCMIGSESFISLDSMVQSPTQLVLLSKMPCPCQRPGENCWSLYVLKKPATEELHQDIVDLAASYQCSKLMAYEHLLYLDYVLLISHASSRGATEQIQHLLCDAALALGLHFARSIPSEIDHCVNFLQQSLYDPITVLKQYLDGQDNVTHDDTELPSAGIIKYLDVNLLAKECQLINQENEEMVVSFYMPWSPARLMYLVLTKKLSPSSYLTVADHVLNEKQLEDDRLHSLHKVTLLAIMNDLTFSQYLIKKIPEDHLKKILLFIPECLFDVSQNLSSLGLLLQQHTPFLMTDVLKSLIDQKRMVIGLNRFQKHALPTDATLDSLIKYYQEMD